MQKALLRSEIEKALDELERYEEGMRFQSLAVVLAKQRWPELVAAERRNDIGLDAFVTRAQASDGIGRGLACSITSEYGKIASDAQKVRDNFGDQCQQLVFATSGKVTTNKKIEWARQIHAKFGFELLVISREDIIASLTAPENVGLCRTYLLLDVDIDPSLTTVVTNVRDAAREEAANWARRVADQPLISLLAIRVESNGADGDTVWSLHDIEAALRDARRLVLEAPAGRGKTTTLIQLGNGELSNEGSVFFIDLPSWVKSGLQMLPFLAGMPAFERRGLTPQQLAQAESVERFYFLLNGWNEITESSSNDAVIATKDLERQFPSAGILIATRAHHVSPPLPGSTRLRLRRIARRMRATYVRERLGELASRLLSTIEADPALDELTRTPFILSEVVTVVEAGEEIPRTRVRVMDAVIRLLEKSAEHQFHLGSPPLRGMADAYLQALAMDMVGGDSISLGDSDARASVSRVSELLVADSQFNITPQPSDILNALCAHHLLERIEYPSVAYRFEHQLFQEYYASRSLHRIFGDLVSLKSGSNDQSNFLRQFVNEPAWAEPLRMVAETIGDNDSSLPPRGSDGASRLLVDMTLTVDPIFAAELTNMLGLTVDHPVADALSQRLREWHASNDIHHENCALAGMFASGLGTFRDIIEPLLASGDRQIRLRSNRLWRGFAVSTLGENWRDVVAAWSEDARADFVSEVLHHQFVPEVSAYALADPSATVRLTAMHALSWIGAEEEFIQAANRLNNDEFVLLVLGTSTDLLPASLYQRSRSVIEEHLGNQTDHVQRMQTLLKLHELKDANAVSELKRELDQYAIPKVGEHNDYMLEAVLEAVHESDPSWISGWVAQKIANAELWPDRGRRYLTVIPKSLRDEQFDRITAQNLEHVRLEGPIMIVVHDHDPAIAKAAFSRLVEIQSVIDSTPRGRPLVEWGIHRQIESLLRAISPSVVLAGLTETLAMDPELNVAAALSHLYGQIGQTIPDAVDMDADTRQRLKNYLLRSQQLILNDEDATGGLKAAFASLLSQIGESSNITNILSNVDADLERVRSGREARARGERSALADSSNTTQTHSYVRSIVTLLGDKADAVLLKLLQEPEYEAAVIEEFGRQFDQPGLRGFGRKKPYEQIWKARSSAAAAHSDSVRRDVIAAAMRDRMRQLDATRSEEKPGSQVLNHRLKKLALGLAQTAPTQFAELILETMSLPAEFDAWVRVDALERLLFSGAALPAQKCLQLLDAPIEQMIKWGIRDQERWLLIRYLSVCPYVTPQSEGITKIRATISQVRFSIYDFRELLTSLGYCRFEGALALMRGLVPSSQEWRAIEHEWVSALTTLDTQGARTMTLGFVDPELSGLPFTLELGPGDQAATRIAEIAAGDALVDARLRALSLLSLDDARRHLLAKSLAARGTPEATLALLNLMDDTARDTVPWEVRKFLEQTFVQREPYRGSENTFTLKAAASNTVRAMLFQMVFSDTKRKHSAYSLLGEIEEWRLEYGRPVDEPRHPALESGLPWPPPEPK